MREYITRVLEFADYGPLLLVVFITVVNGVAEEMFFRGALYTALGQRSSGADLDGALRRRRLSAAGNPMLGFAAVILGTVCASNAEPPGECSHRC